MIKMKNEWRSNEAVYEWLKMNWSVVKPHDIPTMERMIRIKTMSSILVIVKNDYICV